MPFLNLDKLCIALIFVTTGCASSTYRITNYDMGRTELSVTPDRILLECEDVSENREIPYGFMIHVLDDANSVIDVTQMNTLSKEGCQDRLVKIDHILRTGLQIYIAGYGNLDEPRKIETSTYSFSKHGLFHANGRFLQFAAIANEHGFCYGAQTADTKPCPDGEDFPIRDKR